LAQSMDKKADCVEIGEMSEPSERNVEMTQYQGYDIVRNPETGKWEVFWKGRKVEGEFLREAEAEEWIDDQFPSHRF
jgi:hypothetical protein